MIKFIAILAAFSLIAGCAGSPIANANDPNKIVISVGDETVYVTAKDGVWSASFKDFAAKLVHADGQEVMRRKGVLRSAIEKVTKCRVVDSEINVGAISILAVAQCGALPGAVSPSPAGTTATDTPTESVASSPAPTGNRFVLAPDDAGSPRPKVTGQYGFEAEKLAKSRSCASAPRATLSVKGPGFESFNVPCANGDTMIIRCEYGSCRVLQ